MKRILTAILVFGIMVAKAQVSDEGHQIKYLTWSDTTSTKQYKIASAVPNLIKAPSPSQQRYVFVCNDQQGTTSHTEESICYIDEIGNMKKAYIFGNGESVYFELHDMITSASEDNNPASVRKVRFFYFIGADKNLHILFAKTFFPF